MRWDWLTHRHTKESSSALEAAPLGKDYVTSNWKYQCWGQRHPEQIPRAEVEFQRATWS